MSANQIWERDKIKIGWMENRNYSVLTIWESEYKKNPEETLNRCLSFLDETI
jgi:very-short-patch-repair endonuclease